MSCSDNFKIYLKSKSSNDANQIVKNDKSKYLLIKAWGFGFFSDVNHIIGQLLIAELTGRIPIVYWGKNSLFGEVEKNKMRAA